jgi:hypothetical protein
MLAAAGVLGVMAGMTSAYLARWLPSRGQAIETVAGLMLLGGFALVGSAMPVIL